MLHFLILYSNVFDGQMYAVDCKKSLGCLFLSGSEVDCAWRGLGFMTDVHFFVNGDKALGWLACHW